jgi:hypothetical protein
MAHDIFISYSTKDKPTADAACAMLEAAGIRCWIAPRDISPGAEWGDSIIQALSKSRAMVLVFSSNANESPQIRREVERAVSKGIPVIPLRIEDIAPTHSLEYFIGTVHWLDALTPPLEGHLRRLADTVTALLNPGGSVPKIPEPVPPPPHPRTALPWIAIAILAAVVIAGGSAWWFFSQRASAPVIQVPAASVPSTPAPATPSLPQASLPRPPRVAGVVDPRIVGTLEYSTVVDGYDWHWVNTIDAQGSYQLVVTQEESGTYQAAQGHYRTVAVKTGRVREGTYVAVGTDAFQVTNAAGSVVYRSQKPIAPLDQANPILLGVWQAEAVVNGLSWALTLQNNPDGTYHFKARAKDHGTCHMMNGVWQSTSAVTGQSVPGSYRILNAHEIELTSAVGTGVWQRH